LSEASFEAFPFFVLRNWEAEGLWQRGRPSLLTFFGEAKKVSGRRATPDLRTVSTSEIKLAKEKSRTLYGPAYIKLTNHQKLPLAANTPVKKTTSQTICQS
jgi:hypothetical protein